MSLIEEIGRLGADVEDALNRFMGNAALYERMLKKYPDVAEKSSVMPFIDSGDLETAAAHAHTLKGVVGNLSLNVLYEGYSRIVLLLREGKADEARELLEKTLESERPIIETIKKYSEQTGGDRS